MARIEYHKQKTPAFKWIIGCALVLLFLTSSIILLISYPFASNERKSYFQGSNSIIYHGSTKGNALFSAKELYLPFDFLKKYLDPNLVYDEKSKSVILTTKDKVLQMPENSLVYFNNRKPVNLSYPSVLSKEGKLYLAADLLADYYALQYRKLPKSGAILIEKNGDSYFKGNIEKNKIKKAKLRLRTGPGLDFPYTAETVLGEPVRIEKELKDYYFVRKEDGSAGYINKDYVHRGEKVEIAISQQVENKPLPLLKSPIQLTWEAVYSKTPDFSKTSPMPGVNVISPTWFSLTEADGTIRNLASLPYSQQAKAKGYKIWGLFSNGFNPELTHEAFKDFSIRDKIIQQLVAFTQKYQLDGVNFDIENVDPKDGPLVTQFMREAVPYLHAEGKTVSMDITFAVGYSNWSSFYERDKLSQVADYLIVMAYDEHTGKSTGAGSVASFPWVEDNLQNLLKQVPEEKLILGVPLYTRLWKEAVMEDGSTELSVQALSMDKVKAWIKEKKLVPRYDSDSGQNYAEYFDPIEKATYKVWIEDELSLKKRADLVSKYKLAGLGSWSRYFADQSAWTALQLNSEKEVSKK